MDKNPHSMREGVISAIFTILFNPIILCSGNHALRALKLPRTILICLSANPFRYKMGGVR
jgi:hypothetical protein